MLIDTHTSMNEEKEERISKAKRQAADPMIYTCSSENLSSEHRL